MTCVVLPSAVHAQSTDAEASPPAESTEAAESGIGATESDSDAPSEGAVSDEGAATSEVVPEAPAGSSDAGGSSETTVSTETAEAGAEEPTPPLEEAEEATPEAVQGDCTAQDVLRGLCSAAEAAASSARKPWRIMGRIDYQQPIVLDRDPETDILMYFYLGGEVDIPLLAGLYATAWAGFSQRFWTVEGESSVDFEDPWVGIGYRHAVPLAGVGLPDHSLNFVHRLSATFPASRASRSNLYYTALDWVTASRFPIAEGFMVGLDARIQYRFHEYAEQNGAALYDGFEYYGGMNTRLRLETGLLLLQNVFDDPTFGNLVVYGATGVRGQLRYPSTESFVSPSSDQELWEGDWYWSLGTTYTPIDYVSITVSIDHGYSDMNRGGVSQIIAADRDETRLSLSLFARY